MGVQAIAHRGGEGLWPSNTLYAFERAVALGVDVLEMDFHRTADGALVIRHDPTVDSTTNAAGEIRSLTLAQIKTLDAGYTWTDDDGRSYPYRGQGITIPTLEEVFQAFPNVRMNFDIKPREPEVVDQFVRTLRDYDRQAWVMVGSFHDRQLARFRQLCPEVPTAAGVSETRRFYMLQRAGLARFFRAAAKAFQIPETAEGRRIITPGFIRSAHALGLRVDVWTVNPLEDMRRLIEWGVDGIITDYPDRLVDLLGRKQQTD